MQMEVGDKRGEDEMEIVDVDGAANDIPEPLAVVSERRMSLISHVVRDHCRVCLFEGVVKPKCTRLRARADLISLTRFVRFLFGVGVGRYDVLFWLCLVHMIHRREPVATAAWHIADMGGECTLANAKNLLERLSDVFKESEFGWDTARPLVGGLVPLKRLVHRHWGVVRSHVVSMSTMAPDGWRIDALDKTLASAIDTLGRCARYQRGHHLRTIAVLAGEFGDVGVPEVLERDWETLVGLLGGSQRMATITDIMSYDDAQDTIRRINGLCDVHAPGARALFGAYNAYDLTCALCLYDKGFERYHIDEGHPFSVRRPQRRNDYI